MVPLLATSLVLWFQAGTASARHVFIGAHGLHLTGTPGIGEVIVLSPDGQHVYVAGAAVQSGASFTRDAGTGALQFVGETEALRDAVSSQQVLHRMAIGPEGRDLYVPAKGGLKVLARDAGTGALSIVAVHDVGTIPQLADPTDVAISADEAHVYVAGSDSVVVFSRDVATGELTFVQVKQDGVGGVTGLDGSSAIALSHDGQNAYVASRLATGSLVVFGRDPITGELEFLEAVVAGPIGDFGARDVVISPDDAHVYVIPDGDNSVAIFSRDSGTGTLSLLDDVVVPGNSSNFRLFSEAISPDGLRLYVTGGVVSAGDSRLHVFARDSASGLLTLDEEFRNSRGGVEGLNGARGMSISSDGQHLYLSSGQDVATFRRLDLACSASARSDCFQPTAAGKAKLVIKREGPEGIGRLVWKWTRGESVSLSDLGDPAATLNDYALCLYSSVGGALLETELLAPAGGGCGRVGDAGGIRCWRPLGTKGFKYSRRDRHPDGVTPIKLLSGPDDRAKVVAKARGLLFPTPVLPHSLPVTVQLQNADGRCWTASYGTARRNDAVTFKAVSD